MSLTSDKIVKLNPLLNCCWKRVERTVYIEIAQEERRQREILQQELERYRQRYGDLAED